ncbi:MAG: Uma2 family endonuclease [Pseudonocardiaceae bacterium]|nr:Uma2 family endonuclease [Pseudonocardiaceae bacterium]
MLDHPLGPSTVDDWLAADAPADGSRLELILGYFHVTPPPTGSHQRASFRLARALEDAVEAVGRDDLHVVPGVGIRISTPWRTGLIPDVAVLDVNPHHVSFAAGNLVLAVEVWSPGNSQSERDTKMAAYAGAGVPYLWIVDLPAGKPPQFCGYRLSGGGYRQDVFAGASDEVIAPGPVPVTVDTARLS